MTLSNLRPCAKMEYLCRATNCFVVYQVDFPNHVDVFTASIFHNGLLLKQFSALTIQECRQGVIEFLEFYR